MKTRKIKRYRLGVSKIFPATHPRRGEETFFVEKIQNNENLFFMSATTRALSEVEFGVKIHAIRSNYPLWEKRMKEVQDGNAVIELFYWSGNPYRSPQVVFATLDENSGCGVQELEFYSNGDGHYDIMNPTVTGSFDIDVNILSENDGLSFDDFFTWFNNYELSEPMAIIHFTEFRY